MNTTHLHLLLNHFPVIGTMVGSGLLLWGIIRKQNNIKTAAAAVLFIMALVAIPVYLTGEPAEDAVEKLPGVAASMIEQHEAAATIAIWIMGITGLAALVALMAYWQKKAAAGVIFTATFILSALSFAAMARTGYYGGQIRHTEIRNGNTAVQNAGNETGEGKKEKDDD